VDAHTLPRRLNQSATSVDYKIVRLYSPDNSCKAPGPLELSKVVDLDTLFDNARVVGREIGGVFSPKLAALPINPKP